MRDVGTLGRPDPFIIVVEARAGLDGANDAVSGDTGFTHALEQNLEHAAEIAPAFGEEARGMGVAVDCGPVGKLVLAGNPVGRTTMEELGFDGFPILVLADAALAGMPRKIHGASLAGKGEPRRDMVVLASVVCTHAVS